MFAAFSSRCQAYVDEAHGLRLKVRDRMADGALLFRADRSATEVYEHVAELHQTRAALERATSLFEELNLAMSTGDYYQTGPPLLKQRFEEMQVAGKRGAEICARIRASLKDRSIIRTDDSNLGKGFDDLSKARLAEIQAGKIPE